MRTKRQQLIDLLTFPIRAITLFYDDKWGLSCQATERYDYASRELKGYCLDLGCGPHNRFIKDFCDNNGIGIDVYQYEGLTAENIHEDMTHLPFEDEKFQTVTLLANINHIPRNQRDEELREVYRVLKPFGNVVITMGNPLAETVVHKVISLHDRFFNTKQDVDSERGMEEGEEFFLTDSEILSLLKKAGFTNIKKKFFVTQWGLNHMFVADKHNIV